MSIDLGPFSTHDSAQDVSKNSNTSAWRGGAENTNGMQNNPPKMGSLEGKFLKKPELNAQKSIFLHKKVGAHSWN